MPTMQLRAFDPVASNNPHAKLSRHLERHVYTKGAFKGDAPADGNRRGRTHHRVVRANNGDMIVRFHHCDLLRASPDGTIVLRTDGYSGSQTTREAFRDALRAFTPWGACLKTRTLNGYTQTVLLGHTIAESPCSEIAWACGTTISPDGVVDNHGAHIYRYVADLPARKAWANNPMVREFKSVLPLLFSAHTSRPEYSDYVNARYRSLHHVVGSRHLSDAIMHPEYWPDLIVALRYDYPTHEAAWKALRVMATEHMRNTVAID